MVIKPQETSGSLVLVSQVVTGDSLPQTIITVNYWCQKLPCSNKRSAYLKQNDVIGRCNRIYVNYRRLQQSKRDHNYRIICCIFITYQIDINIGCQMKEVFEVQGNASKYRSILHKHTQFLISQTSHTSDNGINGYRKDTTSTTSI